jgi:hypothetical protein
MERTTNASVKKRTRLDVVVVLLLLIWSAILDLVPGIQTRERDFNLLDLSAPTNNKLKKRKVTSLSYSSYILASDNHPPAFIIFLFFFPENRAIFSMKLFIAPERQLFLCLF